MRTRYDEHDVRRMIDGLVGRLADTFDGARPINIVGIRTRGETLAARVAEQLAGRGFGRIGRGVLDITLYRDDLSEIGPRPMVRPTRIDVDIDGCPLVLVDDVIFTGRSVRAALNALNDLGRPSAIRLAVLVDRGGRELPIQPDLVGITVPDLAREYQVKVRLTETDGTEEILVGPRG